MKFDKFRTYKTEGSGHFRRDDFRSIGENVVFEAGVLVFHPENIEIGNNVYIGHNTILKGYYRNTLKIGDHTWIGQGCFLHSAGGIKIGKAVGIGPMVKILTSYHVGNENDDIPLLFAPLEYKEVIIEDGSDIGIGSIILPGIRIGKGVQIGAGSVVTKNFDDYSIVAGVPSKIL